VQLTALDISTPNPLDVDPERLSNASLLLAGTSNANVVVEASYWQFFLEACQRRGYDALEAESHLKVVGATPWLP
jgi:hypothetical protein